MNLLDGGIGFGVSRQSPSNNGTLIQSQVQNIFSLIISEVALKPMKKINMLKQYKYILSAPRVQCNEISTTPEPQATCIDKTSCQTNQDCPGGWCFHTGMTQNFCKCNDPIVPPMGCVQQASCKDDIECGPTGVCPTNFWGGAAGSK